ncbi:class I SAM-dependent methyltransferase [Rhizobium leguminosarum]|uniref:class I SAM-dependent methyltransferase n=1 Tax=Rhizobium leguminosarum TaxID=384 RepID=UPI00143F40FA|nr:class I SAM-dependent methyltransferase [Rhizobium leguminosarum]NKL23657.1 class I SAM-dependent methyltransferase [Rhizobium leguminosarum bv. viciae]
MAQSVFLDGESLVLPDAIRQAANGVEAPDLTRLSSAEAELALTLELAIQQFVSSVEPSLIISRLARSLHDMRRNLHAAVWDEIVTIAQSHPVAEFLLQDPLTAWSFAKPRGYSGDAHLLDFIYGRTEVQAEIASASKLGRGIYNYTANASSSVAVRERRDILARRVDGFAAVGAGPIDVLAIASGHLREASLSQALVDKRVARWVALDQDPLSVGLVARDFTGTVVESVNGSVKSLLAGRHALGMFDFVYAAGLYDYLPDPVAIKLAKKCVSMLKPGGTFLFANFSPETDVDGYMETFMNWRLLLRSEHDMARLANECARGIDVGVSVWSGSNRSVVYCEITRKL